MSESESDMDMIMIEIYEEYTEIMARSDIDSNVHYQIAIDISPGFETHSIRTFYWEEEKKIHAMYSGEGEKT